MHELVLFPPSGRSKFRPGKQRISKQVDHIKGEAGEEFFEAVQELRILCEMQKALRKFARVTSDARADAVPFITKF
jgi:hypothetical protein